MQRGALLLSPCLGFVQPAGYCSLAAAPQVHFHLVGSWSVIFLQGWQTHVLP